MEITKNQWLKDVKAEVVALRNYATKSELNLLDVTRINPQNYTMCIYGQMTGDCRSDRSSELVKKCCIKYTYAKDEVMRDWNNFKNQIIENIPQLDRKKTSYWFNYYSALEHYIMMPDADLAGIVAYLKGETDDWNIGEEKPEIIYVEKIKYVSVPETISSQIKQLILQ